MPIARNSLTECWVALVLSSAAACMKGTRVRWTYSTLSLPRSFLSWRIASRNGSPSMSPTVPPTSTMTMSVSRATLRIEALISSVMWGMTCTVRPR